MRSHGAYGYPMTEWALITAAVSIALTGDPGEGQRRLLECWRATPADDHAGRCVLAHYLADLEVDLDREVLWDERALAAYRHVAESDLKPVGITSAEGLGPSLHLNLGDGYLRQGHLDRARTHLDAGLATTHALADDAYGRMIRNGLDGLAQRLDAAQAQRPRPAGDDADQCA